MKAPLLLLTMLFPLFLCVQQISAQVSSGNLGRVEVPGVKGVLLVNVGASPWHLEFEPEDKWAILHAEQRPDHIIVTGLLRQVTFAATAESCKSQLWPEIKQALTKAETLQESSYGGASEVEYSSGDEGAKTQHLLAFWGARDLCAEVHLLKAGFTPDDQPIFEQVLASVRLFPDESGLQTAAQAPDSSTLNAQGDELYALKDYNGAVKYYQKALDLERGHRTFDKDLFLDLIGRVAFCYRLSGNLTKARTTLEFGLSEDAEHSLFHYDMACVYAQMGKLDESLGQLNQAYKYKANAGLGDLPPNPGEDSCFQKIATDPRFMDTVQKLQSQ